MNLKEAKQSLRDKFASDETTEALKVSIIVWALAIIALALLLDNKWILAGILAWEVLP